MVEQTTESLFLAIGLEPKFVQQTLKNPKITKILTEVLQSANVTKCEKKIGFYFFPNFFINFSFKRSLALQYSYHSS